MGLGWVTPKELDEAGISEALRLATSRAVKEVQKLKVSFAQVVIDGKVNFLSRTPLAKYVSTMPKADDLVKEVSAASIVAKVARDAYMKEAGLKFPEYGFENHMGYGTLADRGFHEDRIRKYCDLGHGLKGQRSGCIDAASGQGNAGTVSPSYQVQRT